MLRRSLLTVAVAAAALVACAPSVSHTNPPTAVDYAVFDPTAASPALPLPNDLALQQAASQTGAQGELLQSFAAVGGFPNDQEVPVTIDFVRQNIDSAGKITNTAPDLDVTTLGPATLFAIAVSPTGVAEPADLDTIKPADYVKAADKGTLTLHRKANAAAAAGPLGSRRWKAGFQYIVALRGGASGVKTVGGGEVNPQAVTYLITRGKDLSLAQYQTSLPGTTASQRAAAGTQLEQLRLGYLTKGVFTAINAAFPTEEIAVLQTFKVAPAQTGAAVIVDPSAGVVPLPSDLLLDPATGGKTIVNNPAFGPLAAGIATLDGFSTTAMVLSQTTAPIVASTVAGSVFLYDLSNPAAPVRLKEIGETKPTFAGAAYVAEPFQITAQADGTPCSTLTSPPAPGVCVVSTAIGLQPAVGVTPAPGVQVNLPPLKEGTEYAVLVTDGVKDTGGAALKASSLSKVLLFENPLADLATGKGLLPGQSDAQAVGLEQIRLGVRAAAAALSAEKGIAKSHIVLGYTFRTQKITDTALKLAAAPYQQPALFVPGTPTPIPFPTPPLPAAPAVQEVLSVSIPTLNPINVQTGALEPDNTKWTKASLNGLVIVPQAAAGAPLVVFQHGLGRNKGDVFPIANTLASAGFVVAAIDAPLHGDRAYCEANAECVCPTGATGCTPTCTFFGPAGLQGDTVQIGQCTAGSVALSSGGPTGGGVSGRFLVTANFFRTRDALRQDVLDTSALVLALAPLGVPSNPLAAELAAKGVTIDPTKVYWVGQSLGGILGTLNTAANPRIIKAVLNVPGGTVVDVFTQSPSFTTPVNALLASLTPPIVPGTPQYLQFIQVAKLVLDGAEPLNFGGHLLGDAAHPTLPDLLQSKPNQAAKNVFGQYAVCDQTIPNNFNLLLFGEIGLASGTNPNPFTAYTVAGAGTAGACNTDLTTNPAHGFLLNGSSATPVGQSDAAQYLLGTLTPAATRP